MGRFQLHPVWDLVKSVDAAKGARLQEQLEAEWARQANEFNPTRFFEPEPVADAVRGCTDRTAENYDPAATDNDGSCRQRVHGCTNHLAENYREDATDDDGSCRPECRSDYCRETSGTHNNCVVRKNSGIGMNCAGGFVPDITRTTTFNRHYQCCSY